MGWQPVMMCDELTGMPFTRWFPPAKSDAELDRDELTDAMEISTDA